MSDENISVPAGAAPFASKAQLLLQLAERCEHEASSADLDAHIAVALRIGPRNVGDHHWLYRNFPNWLVRADGRVEAQAGGVHWAADPFTSNRDLAETLEPADAQEVCVRKYPGRRMYVRITTASGTAVYCEALDRAIGEPMARCAAALRARAQAAPHAGQGPVRSRE